MRNGEYIMTRIDIFSGFLGAGKTTLTNLILRLYDPTEGQVRLGGRDVKEYRLSSYRDNFSCVFQDFQVFSMSVKENVVLRAPRENDDELVTEALKESGAYDRIMKLEGGIDTTLTREFDENGINLSVGEAQKVSLARVFAENAPCIILDEPSSALDPIAEHKMFENMMRAAEGRSVIFISHRLSDQAKCLVGLTLYVCLNVVYCGSKHLLCFDIDNAILQEICEYTCCDKCKDYDKQQPSLEGVGYTLTLNFGDNSFSAQKGYAQSTG